jgi:hypothetical protein
MPLHWKIDHSRRRVTATLLTTTSEPEMYAFLGEVIAQDAMPYGKIFDGTQATRWISPDRVGPIAATTRLYSRMALGPIGPLAIVIAGQRATARAEEYVLLSDAARRVRIFGHVDEAEAWLASFPEERDAGRGGVARDSDPQNAFPQNALVSDRKTRPEQ